MLSGRWRGPLLGDMLNVGFDILTLYMLFFAAHYTASPGLVLAGYGLPLFAGKLSVLPGGLGVVEGGHGRPVRGPGRPGGHSSRRNPQLSPDLVLDSRDPGFPPWRYCWTASKCEPGGAANA